MVPGSPIGDWVVEEALAGDGRYRCHRRDSPFRKAVLTAYRGHDRRSAEQIVVNLSRLQHPNIGAVLGATASGEELFVVAELVQGATLRSFLRAGDAARIPLRTAVTVGLELADALATVHERGVVHGDVRPENVLLGQDGKARLVGFERMGTSDDLSLAERYAAPELARPGGVPSPATDAYAYGILLYELVSGTGADVRGSSEASLSLDDTTPRALRDLVASLTHPDPLVRPTFAKVRQALHQVLNAWTTPPTVLPPSFPSVPPVSEPAPPLPARIGRYDVVRELGRGGVGVVYEGVDPVLQRRVALKLLIAGSWARPREVQRFKLEAQAVARLDHPGIVKILDIGGDLEGAWFAMEYVDGPTLADRLRERGGRLPWREAAAIAGQVARALESAHRAGLLHRDVKPNNVLLDGDRAKLADFGLALDAQSDQTRLTGTGQVLGTPMYMAPEQAAGEIDRLGPHTDVYGVGVLLYEALTGRVPYDGATPLQVISSILEGNAPGPRRFVPDLPRALDTVTSTALRLEPRERYASAAAFADDLDRCLAGDAILAAEPSAFERIRHAARRHARLLVVAGVAAVLVLTTVGLVAGAARAVDAFGRERNAGQALEGTRRRIRESLAARRPDEAEAAFRTFVGRPEHVGTVALVEAWRDWAEVRAGQADGEGRLSALSSAYLAAPDPEQESRTLLSLARAARDERRFELLLPVTDLLSVRFPHLESEIRSLRRDALAAERLLGPAAAVDPGSPAAALLVAWAEGRRTTWQGARVSAVPGRPDRRLVTADGWLSLTDAGLVPVPEHAPVAVARAPEVFDWGDRVDLVVGGPGPTADTFALAADGFVRGPAFPHGELAVGAAADLDGDGSREGWYGAWRKLYRLDRTPDGFRTTGAHAETNESNSQIRDVLVTDLDGNGADELVVSAAEWGAYDVRRFAWDDERSALALRGRIKLGVVSDLAVARGATGSPLVAACKTDEYPNLRVFPESAPTGARAGVWELSLGADGRLSPRLVLAARCRAVASGDFDGDGRVDLASNDGVRSVVLLRRADDSFEEVWIEDSAVVAVLQADADPADEVVLEDLRDDRRTWLLGVRGGPDQLPERPRVVTAPVPPPPATPSFRQTWSRAEDLVRIGRPREAQGAFRDLATLRWGFDEGTLALLRAADLAADRSAWDEASALYLEADTLPSVPVAEAPLLAAVRARRAAHDEPGELELLLRARDRGLLDDAGSARLGLLQTSGGPSTVLSFDAPLDPRWRVSDALQAWRDGGAGELVLSTTGPGELLRLPVVRDGRWLGLAVDGVVERTEWGSSLQVELVPRGASEGTVGLRLGGMGGGERVERRLLCEGPGGLSGGGALPTAPETALSAGLFLQADGTIRCTADGHLPDWRDGETKAPVALPAGEWDLVVSSASAPTAASTVRLRRIRLTGVRVDAAAGEGDPRALAVAEGASAVGDPFDAFAVAAHGDDANAVVRRWRALTGDPRAERAELWLLHARLDPFGRALRPVWGPDWYGALARSWASPLLSQGRRDPALGLVLSRFTDGLEAAAPRDPLEASRLQLLLLMKGACALHDGDPAAARRALLRAVDLGIPDAAGVGGEEMAWTRSWVAVGLVDLAELAMADGDAEGAFGFLRQAFATTPVPVVLADVVAARARLEPLREDPRWEPFERLGSGAADPAP